MVERTVDLGMRRVSSFASIDELEAANRVHSGTIVIKGQVPCFFRWTNNRARTTVVCFAGAIKPDIMTVPVYAGKKVTLGLFANVILVSDPSLMLDNTLLIGWYAGNRQVPNYQETCARAIKALARGTDIILFGPSAGGFAALEQGLRIPESTVLATNPQTNLLRYYPGHVARYCDLAWGLDRPKRSDLELPFRALVTNGFAHPVDTRVVYVQNVQDEFHIKNHLTPFRTNCHGANKVVYLEPDLGPGHISPDRPSARRLLATMIKHRDWNTLTERISNVVLTHGRR